MNDLKTVGGNQYQIGRLNAIDQFHVSRRLAPVLPTIAPLLVQIHQSGLIQKIDDGGVEAVLDGDLAKLAEEAMPLADALADMSDEHANYIILKCLSVVRRKTDTGFAAMCRGGTLAYDDMEMMDMLPLVLAVVQASLGNFIGGLATSKTVAASQPE